MEVASATTAYELRYKRRLLHQTHSPTVALRTHGRAETGCAVTAHTDSALRAGANPLEVPFPRTRFQR
jgi:hypothetical protein